MSATKIFSEHAPVYEKINLNPNRKKYNGDFVQTATKTRENKNTFDLVNYELLTNSYDNWEDFEKLNENLNIPFVMLQIYDSSEKIFLPGTISGLSEDFSPEWNGFKYVGSPFNVYRYGGIERSIKFELKLYYTDAATKKTMVNNLNRIRKIVYPSEDLISINYPNNGGYSPVVFKPNLVYLTINGLYQRLFGLIDSLSFSIDDNTPWPVTTDDMDMIKEKPHPAVINISFGFKVIENPEIKEENGKKKLVYAFEGKIIKGKISAGAPEKIGNV
jgi:hypothetical protein